MNPTKCFALSLFPACSDYSLSDVKDAELTEAAVTGSCTNGLDDDGDGLTDEEDPDCDESASGELPPPDNTEEQPCYVFDEYGHNTPGTGWNENVCHAFDPALFFPGNYYLSGFELKGSGAFPGETTPVRLVQAIGGDGYPSSGNLASDGAFPVGASGYWHAEFESGELGGLQTGLGGEWTPFANIYDTVNAASDTCGVYQTIEFCPTLVDASAARRVPSTTTCEDGSGTFRLVPRRLIDHDEDENFAATFSVVMTSGTGTLTNAAWIRTARVSNNASLGFRVVKANRPIEFDGADQLVAPLPTSIAVGSTTANILAGAVSGGAPWVLSEFGGSTQMNPEVELSWECATPTEQEETNASLGFMFSPGQVGCNVGWTQRFTVRPHPSFVPSRIQLQLYGNSALNREYPVEDLGDGRYRFRAALGGLSFFGTIDDIDANQGMVVSSRRMHPR